MKLLSGDRMAEFQNSRVKGLPSDQIVCCAIHPVTGDRMADRCHMNADLVSPACFQADSERSGISLCIIQDSLEMGHRAFSACETDHPHDCRTGDSRDRQIDDTWKRRPDGRCGLIIVCRVGRDYTGAVGQTAMNDGEVFPVNRHRRGWQRLPCFSRSAPVRWCFCQAG